MGDYNVAFKYNKRITTDNSAYPWPLNWDKYSLDRKMLNEDLRHGGLVERSRAAAVQQLNDPVTRMRFLQGKGQVEGISLSSLHRRSVLDGSKPMMSMSMKRPADESLLFVNMQQGDDWVDEMNTHDQAQKLHLPLGVGGSHNKEILKHSVKDVTLRNRERSYSVLDQAIMEATAAPPVRSPFKDVETVFPDIPPTPAHIKNLQKRQRRTQQQLLLEDANVYQSELARRASLSTSARKMVGERLLNNAALLSAPKMLNPHTRLQPLDRLERRGSESQQQWATRMRKEAARVDANLQKFAEQSQQLQRMRSYSTQNSSEETKEATQKSAQKPPAPSLRRTSSFSGKAESKGGGRSREASFFL